MRDMQERKFAGCCRYIGFNPVPKGKSPDLEFVSDDGALRVPAVMQSTPLGTRLYRRGSLEKLVAAARARPVNKEAPGAGTPRASDDQTRLGD